MKYTYVPVATDQYKEEVPKWLDFLKNGDSAAILFFPKTDRLRRINQLLEDTDFLQKHLGKDKRYLLQFSNFSTVNVEDVFDMQEALTKQLNFSHIAPTQKSFDDWMNYLRKNNIRLCLFLHNADTYLTGNQSIFSLLSQLTAAYLHDMSVLSFFEQDITLPQVAESLPSDTTLYENILYYPLYDEKDTLGFLTYLENKWNFSIPRKLKTQWIKKYGGHFWLIKEAARYYFHTKKWTPDEDGLHFRTETILRALTDSESSVLEFLGRNDHSISKTCMPSVHHLKRLHAVGDNLQVLVPALSDYLITQHQKSTAFSVKNSEIFLNEVPITDLFSRKEKRVLALLIEKSPSIISRNSIAGAIWPQDTAKSYSDWAIDRMISRIRSKLKKLKQSPEVLHSQRGRGYVFRV